MEYIVKSRTGYEGENLIDNNNIKIHHIMLIFVKVIKLASFVGILSYLTGILWYIFCDILKNDKFDDNFILAFELDKKSDREKAIVVTYWALTTLSRVGIGDYYPKNNHERLFCSAILLMSTIIFSLILSHWVQIISRNSRSNINFQDGENLTKFLFLLARFDNQN